MSSKENTKETALKLAEINPPEVSAESYWVAEPEKNRRYPMRFVRVGDELMTAQQAKEVSKAIMEVADE